MEVVCELLPVINTFNVYVKTEIAENIKNVEITENSIKLIDGSSRVFVLKLRSGIRLNKTSRIDLQHETKWLCFRAKLEQKTRVVSSVLLDIVREIPNLIINSDHISDKINIPLQLLCICGFPISEFKVYHKICPLPMADWDHVSEDWFCHLQGNQIDVVKKKGIYPQKNEFYYNELFFSVNQNELSVEILRDHILCKGCLSEIGYQKGQMLKLWTNDVKWVDEQKVIYEKKSSEILYSLLQVLEKESLGSSTRLVLESLSSTKELLYIVTMDNQLSIFVTENSPLGNYEMQENTKKKRLDETNCFSLRKRQCIKVLYKHKTELDDESGMWNDDVNVNILQCGNSFFKSIICLLDHSNLCVPESIRTVNDLKIGYVLKSK